MLDEQSLVALMALAVAALTWPAATRSPLHRLPGAVSPSFRLSATGARVPAVGPTGRRWLVAVAAGAVVGVLLGGGLLAWSSAAAVTLGLERCARVRASARSGVGQLAVERDVPVVCDLLAVCLGTGLPLGTALAEVAATVPGPAGGRLGEVAVSIALGTDPAQAWAAAPAELAPLGRVLIRGAESGSSVGGGLRALAAQLRASAGTRAEAAVRRAGVWILAPLGLCFLPAFVCLGVLPLVLGIAGNVFR